ncbi:hypothetical protein [Mesorhizobium sp.]|uniref:hypothetical protein n=1 Tax=Mesorhizobium sp. TaxID=1871066 RepID=UPI000FE8BB0F|nr:hypothetical protein [Mesorhizobium sp.]RWB26413.1 MAG: hypothetical protein EOQ43_30830 [Mesorhizobium sp.]
MLTLGSVKAQDLDKALTNLPAKQAVDLLELRDRWNELLAIDRTDQATPFSQTGIKVVADGLARLLALPADVRKTELEGLKSGKLDRLLPPEILAKYCTETDSVSQALEDPGSGKISVVLPAEVVHAAPVLAAISSELSALIDRTSDSKVADPETSLKEVRNALLDYLALSRARAAIELLTMPTDDHGSGAAELLRRTLDKVQPLADLAARLPTSELGEINLCIPVGASWPQLKTIDDRTRSDWAKVKAGYDDFFKTAAAPLGEAVSKAEKALSVLPPLKELINPATGAPDLVGGAALGWRIFYQFVPSSAAANIGTVELLAVNNSMRLSVPLGLSISNVERTRGGQAALKVLGDVIIQSVKADALQLQDALTQAGLSDWARIGSPHLSFGKGADLRSIFVDMKIALPAVGIEELPLRLTLIDADHPVTVESELERLATELAAALAKKLLANPPTVVTGWGQVQMEVAAVAADRTIKGGPWQLSVTGKLRTPLSEKPLVNAVVELGPGGGSSFRLRSATISPELQGLFIDRINAAFDKAISTVAELANVTPDTNSYLRRCIGLEGIEAGPGTDGSTVALFVKVTAGGTSQRLELKSSDGNAFAAALINVVKDGVVKCAVEQLAAYKARQLLKMTEDEIKARIDALAKSQIELLGIRFSLGNIRQPAGSRGFVFDLVGTTGRGDAVRFAELELKTDQWKPEQLLSLPDLDISGARITPADVRALLISVIGIPEGLMDKVDVVFSGGKILVTPHLTIGALGGEIAVPQLVIDLAMPAAGLRDAFLNSANGVVTELVKERLGTMLPDLGVITAVSLDAAQSRFLPVGGQNAKVALDVTTDLKYAVVTWKVTVEIDASGRSTLSVDAGDLQGQLLPIATEFLAKSLQGIAPGGFENINVLTSAPYGVAFDVKADVGAFKVTLPGVRITSKKLELGSRIKLAYQQPPGIQIPPFFQALPVDLTIDLDHFADFEIGATITISGDDYGVIGLDARLQGRGSEKRLETEGVIKILKTLSLVRSKGVVDFRAGTITMRTETVGELSKLLDIGDQITINTKPMEAEIAARMNLLGIGADGHLKVEANGERAVITLGGRAKLLLGDANVDVILDSRLRGSAASGSVETFIGVAAKLTVTPATAQVGLDFRGFRIKLIAPSVTQLTRAMLSEALRRLFDFKLSLDAIKKGEIVVSLVDSSGRPDTDPLGGDPIDGKAPDQAESEAGQQQESDKKRPHEAPPPIPVTPGAGGDAHSFGEAKPGCGIPNSKMVGSDTVFPGHVVEMREAPGVYYYQSGSRVARKDVWDAIKDLPQVACFSFSGLDYPKFDLADGFVVASPLVQVFVDNGGQPIIMVWRRDTPPRPLPVTDEERPLLFPGTTPDELKQAAAAGFETKGLAFRLLRLLVSREINAPDAVKIVNIVKVAPSHLANAGIDSPEGAIGKLTRNGKEFLRPFVPGDWEERGDLDIQSGDPLFALLDDPQARKGPLGQLVVAAAAVGNRLLVIEAAPSCSLLLPDAVDAGTSWRDRLFAVTPASLGAIQLVTPARTVQTISAAKAGQATCAAVMGLDGTPGWRILSAGPVTDKEAAFVFAREIDGPSWRMRLTLTDFPSDRAKANPDTVRERIGSEIEADLGRWANQGSVPSPLLSRPNLDIEGRRVLLDTMALPEAGYLDRILINPRGLLP